jgi:hypothetical protein
LVRFSLQTSLRSDASDILLASVGAPQNSYSAASPELGLEELLENVLTEAATKMASEQLQCSNYAGPMFLPYNPGGTIKKTKPLQGAKMPDALEDQPTGPAPEVVGGCPDGGCDTSARPRWPLRPFSAHETRLLSGSRFHTAEATNLAFLRLLEPDRLLYYFRHRAKVPQVNGAKPYGGWESGGHVLRGEFIGHYLVAAATAAASTGDAELRRRAA